ncbi:MAG: protoporphyrinogen oxidase HemJ [Gammaproteobacteria bacterium]
MLWIKAFHIVFVVFWYAGLLYLPRLFVYHAHTEDEAGLERFKTMERRLLAITNIGAAGALALGLYLWLGAMAMYTGAGWLHAKLVLVVVLVAYHLYCWRAVRAFAMGDNKHSARFYRLFNEVPALILIAVVILVVVKPF